jgi:hypothetical protein
MAWYFDPSAQHVIVLKHLVVRHDDDYWSALSSYPNWSRPLGIEDGRTLTVVSWNASRATTTRSPISVVEEELGVGTCRGTWIAQRNAPGAWYTWRTGTTCAHDDSRTKEDVAIAAEAREHAELDVRPASLRHAPQAIPMDGFEVGEGPHGPHSASSR